MNFDMFELACKTPVSVVDVVPQRLSQFARDRFEPSVIEHIQPPWIGIDPPMVREIRIRLNHEKEITQAKVDKL
jgi:hypothetical protein